MFLATCMSTCCVQLLNKKGKALILSEYGVGGGIHQNGSVPAQTADEAASLPFFGIFGAYNPTTGTLPAIAMGCRPWFCGKCIHMEAMQNRLYTCVMPCIGCFSPTRPPSCVHSLCRPLEDHCT